MFEFGNLREPLRRRVLFASLSIGFSCFSFTTMYFYAFPTLGNATVSDALVISALVAWTGALVVATVVSKRSGEIAVVLLGIASLAFIIQSIPYLRLGASFLHDPYFYAVSTQNIIGSGTLSPALGGWYPQVGALLPWPIMQLVTVAGSMATGSNPTLWYAFQEPGVGALTSAATFMLARASTKNSSASLMAAIFVATSDLVIYYQSEYHSQGLALMFLVMFLYVFLRSRTSRGLASAILPLLFAGDLVFVHHFTSLFVGILAVGFVLVGLITERTPLRRMRSLWHPPTLGADFTLWAVVAVGALAYHILFYPTVFQSFVVLLGEAAPPSLLVSTGSLVPLAATIGNAAKWGVLLLAGVGIWKSLGALGSDLYRLLVLFLLLMTAGALADFVTGGPTERIVAFYVPIAAVFSGLGVWHLIHSRGLNRRRRAVRSSVVLVAVVALSVLTLVNSQVPAMFFHGTSPNPYYFSSNDLSTVGVYNATGAWIARHTPTGSTFATEFDTRMIPFYYAGRPLDDDHYVGSGTGNISEFGKSAFVVFNPSIGYVYQNTPFNQTAFFVDNTIVYSNGHVAIALTPSS